MSSQPVITRQKLYRVNARCLERIMSAHLSARGLSSLHTDDVVEGLMKASLRGIDTHGVHLFKLYLDELDGGRSVASPEIRISHPTEATARINAGGALGLVAGMEATRFIIQRAPKTGVAAVSVFNSNHFGPASCFTLEMAAQDLIGMSFSQADAQVAPFNGFRPFFGANPISVAVPAEGGESFCLDMATSQTSYTAAKEMADTGHPLPEGWAVDQMGRDVGGGTGFNALQPLGGYKGQGLAMVVEILCALLADAPFDHELQQLMEKPYDTPRRLSHFFVAFDIAAFQNPAYFRRRMSSLMRMVRSQESAGIEDICVPGDKENRHYRDRARHGIPLSEADFETFTDLADEVGHTLDLLETVSHPPEA